MPFKTATELGLTEPQYCGLVKTLAALEEDKLDHENEYTLGFDMAQWGGSCGTVCCLGGTAEVLGKCKLRVYHSDAPPTPNWYRPNKNHYWSPSKELHRLFYPDHNRAAYWANTRQAAVALRHYLTTGKENWKLAMETP